MNRKQGCFLILTLIMVVAHAETPQMPWPQAMPTASAKQTGSTKEALAQARQIGTTYLNDRLKLSTWLTRTDIDYTVQDDYKPIGSIVTVQPLYLNNWDTFFVQGRAAYSGSEITGNLGLGYRYLTDNRQFMWGLNTFYDQNITRTHKRIGVGGEMFTPYLAFRANYYDAISGARLVNSFTERALTGYDGRIESAVPFVPWVRFIVEGYHWDGVNTANVNGGGAFFRVFPTPQLEADLGVFHDNSQGTQAFLQLSYYIDSPLFIQYSATKSGFSKGFEPLDLERLRLEKVRRNNNIVVERTSSTSGSSGSIVIARGT